MATGPAFFLTEAVADILEKSSPVSLGPYGKPGSHLLQDGKSDGNGGPDIGGHCNKVTEAMGCFGRGFGGGGGAPFFVRQPWAV